MKLNLVVISLLVAAVLTKTEKPCLIINITSKNFDILFEDPEGKCK